MLAVLIYRRAHGDLNALPTLTAIHLRVAFELSLRMASQHDDQHLVCHEREEARSITVAHYLNEYRQRLNGAGDHDQHDTIHRAIADEPAGDHTNLGVCTAAIWSTSLRLQEQSPA